MMPVTLLAILVVGLSTLGAVALVYLVRVTQRGRTVVQGTPDVEGIYIVALGTFYAIFVAFMIFVVWTDFYEALELTEQEADTLATVYRLSEQLPQPYQDRLQQAAVNYGTTMVRYEWDDMANDRFPERGYQAVHRMWDVMNSLDQDAIQDEVLRDHLLDAFTELTALRRMRLLQATVRLPGILYAVLIFGAVLILGFAAIFTVDRFWPHALKAAVLAALISFMLLSISVLDHPFAGGVRVTPAAFQQTLESLERNS